MLNIILVTLLPSLLLAQDPPARQPIYNRYRPYLPDLCDNKNVGPRHDDCSSDSSSSNRNLGPSSFDTSISSCVNVGEVKEPCGRPVNIDHDRCHGPDIHNPMPPHESTQDCSSSSHHHRHRHHRRHGHHGCGRPHPPPPPPNCGEPSKLDLSSSLEQICMKANTGWYKFYYGNSGTIAWQTYNFNLPYQSVVTLTDCFCPGDRFQLIDNGHVLLDVDQCAPPSQPCTLQNQLANPDQCVHNQAFCSGSAILPPGPHNLTIGVLESNATAGASFIRLDEICFIDDGPAEIAVPCCFEWEECEFLWYPSFSKKLAKKSA